MRKIVVSEFISLDGVVQAPGGADEDTDGGFAHGGWTMPYWHDAIGEHFGALMDECDTFLLGRRTWEIHGGAFEPMEPGDPFGDVMNAMPKYVVSTTLTSTAARNSTLINDDVVGAIRALKDQPGKNIAIDGSSQLVQTLAEHDLVDEYRLIVHPVLLGGGKTIFAEGPRTDLRLEEAQPLPTGVVLTRYVRAED